MINGEAGSRARAVRNGWRSPLSWNIRARTRIIMTLTSSDGWIPIESEEQPAIRRAVAIVAAGGALQAREQQEEERDPESDPGEPHHRAVIDDRRHRERDTAHDHPLHLRIELRPGACCRGSPSRGSEGRSCRSRGSSGSTANRPPRGTVASVDTPIVERGSCRPVPFIGWAPGRRSSAAWPVRSPEGGAS